MSYKLTDKQQMDIENLQSKLVTNPEDSESYWQLGNKYDAVDDRSNAVDYYYKAMKCLKVAIKNHTNDPEKYNLMGLCLSDVGLPHQAIAYYRRAIRLNPDSHIYYYNLSVSENTVKDYRNCVKDMEHSIQLYPYSSDSYNQLCIMNEAAGNYQQSAKNAEIAISMENRYHNHEEPYYYYNLAYAEDKLGHYSQGIDHISYAIGLFSSKAAVPSNYTKCLESLRSDLKESQTDDKEYEEDGDYDYDYEHGKDDLSYDPNVDYTQKLNELIGLKPVKSILQTFVHQVQMNEIRTGKRKHQRMHLVFEGNPGTGKTTVAKLFCRILYQKHIISKKRFTSINATQLVFSRYGKSAKQVRRIVRQSVGGVLFIDEAYYLAHRNDGNSVCQDEAMDAFLSAIDQHNDDLVVIMAGYTNKMENLLRKSNPGLQSRFPKAERIQFPNYSSHECLKILDYFMHQKGFQIDTAKSRQLLNRDMRKYIVTRLNDSRNTFANARTVENICDQLINNFSNRLLKQHSVSELKAMKQNADPVLNEIASNDVKQTFKCFSFWQSNEAATELNNLIGLKNVKALVQSYVNLVKIAKLRHGDVHPDGMNLIFKGNPGTGKTTVAKIFCKLLYQKGLVKSDNYVCVSASMLESSVVGQSAKRLRQAFYEAKGGVLFIDEAYALLNTKQKGSNLIPELVDDLTEYKNSVVVILAGYPKAMENLMKHGNAGLSSRFTYRVPFKDYSDQECLQILNYDLKRDSLWIKSDRAKILLKRGFTKFIKRARTNQQYHFANARTVNVFFKYLKQNFANRLCQSASDTWLKTLKILQDVRLNTVTYHDVNQTLKQCDNLYQDSNQGVIGFH